MYRVRLAICWTSAALLAGGACSSASEPAAPEPLTVSSATVDAALAYLGSYDSIPASCGSSPAINCPGGTAGAPIHVPATITAHSVTPHAAPDTLVFDWAADVKIISPGIPVTLPVVGACTLTVDTRPGTDSTVHVTGTATFSRRTANGPIDRVDIQSQTLTGLTTDDLSLSGGIGCAAASASLGLLVGTLTDFLATRELGLCSAPGPALLEVCKP